MEELGCQEGIENQYMYKQENCLRKLLYPIPHGPRATPRANMYIDFPEHSVDSQPMGTLRDLQAPAGQETIIYLNNLY